VYLTKAIGMKLRMNKFSMLFGLAMLTSDAFAQLKIFESGDTIRADDMNQNFEILADDIDDLTVDLNQLDSSTSIKINQNYDSLSSELASLTDTVTTLAAKAAALEAEIADLKSSGVSSQSKVPCSASSLSGRWISTFSFDGDYEIVTAIFNSNGTLIAYSETAEYGLVRAEGTYTINDKCAVRGSVTSSLSSSELYAWYEDYGQALTGLVYSSATRLWTAGTLIRYDR